MSLQSQVIRDFPAKECGAAPAFDEYFQLKSNQRSANNEDKWIYDNLFKGKSNENMENLFFQTALVESKHGKNYVDLTDISPSEVSMEINHYSFYTIGRQMPSWPPKLLPPLKV